MKLVAVRLAAAIGLLNVASTWLLTATPFAGGCVATGTVVVTTGATPTTGVTPGITPS